MPYLAQLDLPGDVIVVIDSIAAKMHPDWDKKTDNRAATLEQELSVDAYINGKGVIFHLLNGNHECKMTIQADNCEDLVSSFSQLMEYLRSHITLLNNGWSIVM